MLTVAARVIGPVLAMNLHDQRVYRFDLETARWETSFDVDSLSEDWRAEGRPFGLLGREHGSITGSCATPARMAIQPICAPWRDGYRTIDPLRRLAVDPQPMLADLELSDAGELLVGLRDRNGDRTYRRWFEADPARSVGITVYTIGLGAAGDVSDTLLTGIAGDPQRYYRAPEARDLARIYAAIAAAIRICR